MSSNIDATKPAQGAAKTSEVRANFLAAKTEIEALQAAVTAGVSLSDILVSLSNLSGSTNGGIEKTGTSTLAVFSLSAFTKTLLAKTDAAGWRSLLGLGTAAVKAITDFAAASHTHTAADLPTMTGDSGSGGAKGMVPAPGSGDAAATKFLMADGTWKNIQGTVADDLTFNGKKATKPQLDQYSESYKAIGSVSDTSKAVSYADGSVQSMTVAANVAISFTNWPSTGKAASIILILTQDSTGSRAPTFTGVKWAGGSAPTISGTAGDVSILTFLTVDGGTTVYGFNGGLDFS